MPNNVPWPTRDQLVDFASHVSEAHSWYKHLPVDGAEFCFFLAEGAGAGYSESKPRLHHTWKTTEEYRSRFGHLDYMYRDSFGRAYSRDGTAVQPPETLVAECGVTLYPWVSDNEDVIFGVLNRDQWNVGADHPYQAALNEWYPARAAAEEIYQSLSDTERELIWDTSEEDLETMTDTLPEGVGAWLKTDRSAKDLFARMHDAEMAKIWAALKQLKAFAKSGGPALLVEDQDTPAPYLIEVTPTDLNLTSDPAFQLVQPKPAFEPHWGSIER